MSEKGTSLGDRITAHVDGKVAGLQARYRDPNGRSSAAATLALLRRGVGAPLGRDAELVGLTVAGLYEQTGGLPDDRPTEAETAAYTALTLFAVHQQSRRDASMHRLGFSFGRSARLLGRRSGARDAVRARFTAMATATTWNELVHHARGLIQQFRAHGVPLDYGRFARDLYHLQFPTSADRVRLVWGRDFYRITDPEDDDTDAAAAVADAIS